MGIFDKFFDAADSVLGGLEQGLNPAKPDPKPPEPVPTIEGDSDIIDAESTETPTERHAQWEGPKSILVGEATFKALEEHAKKLGVTTENLTGKILFTFLDEASKR